MYGTIAEHSAPDSEPCDSLMDIINEECDTQMRLASDTDESIQDSLMEWINEEASLQLLGGHSPRTARAMMCPMPIKFVRSTPSCTEFLEMAALARARVPHISALEPPLLMLCDGRVASPEELAIMAEFERIEEEATEFLSKIVF